MSGQYLDVILFSSTTIIFLWYSRTRENKIVNETPNVVNPVSEVISIVRSFNGSLSFDRDEVKDDLFRKEYKPWAITHSAINENKIGWVYVRGHSPIERSGSLLWYRPGLHKISKDKYEEYIRALLHSVQTCITDALLRSDMRNGKCNVVLDAQNVRFAHLPSMNQMKELIPIFDSLFPGHLGVLVLAVSSLS
jgi:hypothetical protein